MRSPTVSFVCCLAALAIGCTATTGGARELTATPRLTRLLALDGQLVFAYSRVSPDGQFLVYSSERDRGLPVSPANQTMRVIDLGDHHTLLETAGIDGYWSPDSKELIYRSLSEAGDQVSVWNRETGVSKANVMPVNLGDYYSWGHSQGIDTWLTIHGWFVSRQSDGSTGKPERIPPCDEIGRGSRPLLSRDGQRVSVFVSDEVVLRNLRDCADIVRTGVVGAKADWSSDRRYLAFHTPKRTGAGYDLGIFDTKDFTLRRISLEGSILFPSWTDSQALVFRYEGPEYRGFMRADDVFAAPLSTGPVPTHLAYPERIRQLWSDLVPHGQITVVLLWASWSAHTAEALTTFAAANDLDCGASPCARVAAYDPSSNPAAIRRFFTDARAPFIPVEASWAAIQAAGGANQSPTFLLFVDGCLVKRALGSMSRDELRLWVSSRSGDRPMAYGSCNRPQAP